MSSLAQFLLILVICTLTVLIVVVAVQVFQLLHEAKSAVRKFNEKLDSVQDFKEVVKVSETVTKVTKPKSSLGGRFFHRSGAMLRPIKPS